MSGQATHKDMIIFIYESECVFVFLLCDAARREAAQIDAMHYGLATSHMSAFIFCSCFSFSDTDEQSKCPRMHH